MAAGSPARNDNADEIYDQVDDAELLLPRAIRFRLALRACVVAFLAALPLLLEIGGGALVVLGVARIHLPAALVVAGVLLIVEAQQMTRTA
jgi:hypothetical protein